jgi:hypothetical protein
MKAVWVPPSSFGVALKGREDDGYSGNGGRFDEAEISLFTRSVATVDLTAG